MSLTGALNCNPKICLILLFSWLLRAFSGDLSARELRTQSRMRKLSQNEGGSSPWIFDFVARIRARILTKNGAETVPEVVDFTRILQPFFPVPSRRTVRILSGKWSGFRVDFFSPVSLSQAINAKSMPPKFQKSAPIYETFSLSGCSTPVCVESVSVYPVYGNPGPSKNLLGTRQVLRSPLKGSCFQGALSCPKRRRFCAPSTRKPAE